MSESHDIVIHDLAEYVRNKIEGGRLYGDPIDMNNQDHLILAAYLVGQFEVEEKRIGDLRRLQLLERRS